MTRDVSNLCTPLCQRVAQNGKRGFKDQVKTVTIARRATAHYSSLTTKKKINLFERERKKAKQSTRYIECRMLRQVIKKTGLIQKRIR